MKLFLAMTIGICIGFLMGLEEENHEARELEGDIQELLADNMEAWAMIQELRATLAAKGGREL